MSRIPFEKTTEPNSVELLFAEKFKELKCHPMTNEFSQIMLGLIMAPPDTEELKILTGEFLSQIITKRFAALGYTMDDKTNIFITVIGETPGMAVMYSHYLAYWCKKNKVEHLNFNDFCTYIFPMGFPSTEDLSALWDTQKLEGHSGSDNLLDYFRASNSIMNVKDI